MNNGTSGGAEKGIGCDETELTKDHEERRGKACSSDVVSDPLLCKYYVRCVGVETGGGGGRTNLQGVRGFHYGI